MDAGYASHPYCSPSCAGVLTGRYQQRVGHGSNPESGTEGEGDNPPAMALSARTLADVFGEAGYATVAAGKWQLGGAKKFWPKSFDPQRF